VGRALRLPVVRDQLAQRILPEADVHRLLSLEEDPRYRALLTVLYASGIREGELAGLQWRDLSPTADGGQVTVLGKGTKTPFDAAAAVGLEADPGASAGQGRERSGFCVAQEEALECESGLADCPRRGAPASS